MHDFAIMSYFSTLLFIISLTFTLIRGFKVIGAVLIVVLGLMDLTLTLNSFVIIQLAGNIRFKSEAYYKLAQRTDTTPTKLDSYFYKSCRPLVVNIGELFKIFSRDFCIQTYGHVILETTINLLLAF